MYKRKKEEGTRARRKLRNEEVHHLDLTKSCSRDQIREDEMAGIYAVEEDEKCAQHFSDKI